MEVYKHALGIVNRLSRAGHTAYFAGGWVRDYVMGHQSEDIDIATSALPAEIMDLFPNTILVGLAFGVVIVPISGHQFEIATFRKDLDYIDGRRPQGIEPSTPIEDAKRRDFTINGMFFDPIESIIYDYVQGKEDIQKRIIRTIGDPYERFTEDKLRMLRAFRFAARFEFTVELETQEAIRENTDSLFPSVAMERVWQEFNKMSSYPRFGQALIDMHRLGLLDVIFPEIEHMHLNELKQIVEPFHHFPPECPTILYLMDLFEKSTLDQKVDIAKRIKASNQDIKLLEFFDMLSSLIQKDENGEEIINSTWAHLYSLPHFQLGLDVIAAHYSPEMKNNFLQKHVKRINTLNKHIQRIKERKPLVTSQLLKEHGIPNGKQMGLLLKTAEEIAINNNYDDSIIVLKKLMEMPIWKGCI
ncbi:MAG: CCA tRNA nucleotidyltransferase [Parachlamydiaceae bacterium]|nr:CCA tRNA nucleotidyltransferase [Parachlamydiaceae bacterium]